MKQLELTKNELLIIGFKEKTINESNLYDSTISKERIIFEIPCINGCFYYNKMETEYKWYHKTIIGNTANYIHLNIEKKEELFLLLLCFRVKFNYKTLI